VPNDTNAAILAAQGYGGTNTLAYSGTYCHASSTISSGTIQWSFCDLSRDQITWTFPVETYQQWGKLDHPRDPVRLRTDSGTVLSVNDPRPYVTPSFFDGVISDLTSGRTDKQFVLEAFNVKQSFVTYASSYIDDQKAYQFPAETMTQGTGICGDTTILLASLINSGNAVAHYGMSLSMIMVQMNGAGDALVMPPNSVNHVFLAVTFADGTKWFIESTAKTFTTWSSEQGWSFPVDAYTSQVVQKATSAPPAQQNTNTQPQWHYLANSKNIAISAGGTLHYTFSIQGQVKASYSYSVRDDSTENIGFIRDSDLNSYENGNHVTAYAAHTNVQNQDDDYTFITQQTTYYDFIIHCQNSYFDCDGTYTLALYY
jgi:hypothetical protein